MNSANIGDMESLIQWTDEEVQTLKTPDTAAAFIAGAQQEATQFFSRFKESGHFILNAPQEHGLNEWFYSAAGQRTTVEFVEGVLFFIDRVAPHGLPGHDRRHMIIKTPLAALRFIREEHIEGYTTLLLLSAMLHDIGRIFEPTLYGKPLGGVMGHHHPLFSFCIASRLFAVLPSLPQMLTDHLLYALLSHQKGNTDQFITQAVQRADREQLIGPESIARFLAFDVGLHHQQLHTTKNPKRNYSLPLPGTPEDREFFHHAEFYLRNLDSCIGKKTQHHITELKKISGQFLWMATPEHIRDQIFAPELLRDSGQAYTHHEHKPLLDILLWRAIRSDQESLATHNLDNTQQIDSASIEDMAYELISAPGSSVTVEEIVMINNRIEELSSRERTLLKRGLSYITSLRKHADAQDKKLIEYTLATYSPTQIEYKIAQSIEKIS